MATLVGIGIAVTVGCGLLGLTRSTFYRISRGYRHYQPVVVPVPQAQRYQPAALTTDERAQILCVLTDDDYSDLSVVQAYWRAFDAGRLACSQRSFYRVAKAAGLVGDRRRVRGPGRRASPSRRTPIAVAAGVGDLWSWDVTELRGPRTQDRYKLYLAIDVFSRYPVGWRIEHSEDRQLAVEMFTEAITARGTPKVVHADNGGVMRSPLLIEALTASGVLTSYSRPRVSDDNPFSESLFKTIKYDLDCPDRFEGIEAAREWTCGFLHRYATEHRHSGLGRHTPAAVHHGTAATIHRQRQQHLDRYWSAHPQRFRYRPHPPALPKPTGINTHLSQAG
ncbi:transposase [Nocardia sp. CA-128927]|uniref:transposase n=1 Tax=Nocardia sp. CA-128927 TaxID=3239975 RepID=UPI003D95EDFF